MHHEDDEQIGGLKEMPKVKKMSGIQALPRYIMPDASPPDYEAILAQLQEYHSSLVGSSYFYIRADDMAPMLCRIVYGGGKIYFHEVVDHEKHSISEDDIEDAIRLDTGALTLPGHYLISPHIEMKLRTLYE